MIDTRFRVVLLWSFLLSIGMMGQYLSRELLLLPAFCVIRMNYRLGVSVAYLGFMTCLGFYSQMMFGLDFNVHDFMSLLICLMLVDGFVENSRDVYFMSFLSLFLFIFILVSFFVGICFGNYNYGESYVGYRFMGMAQNPNQLGLYALCVMFIVQSSVLPRLVRYFILMCCFIVGALSGSDAFLFSFVLLALCVILRFFSGRYWLIWLLLLSVGIIILFDCQLLHFDLQSYERLNRWLYAMPLLSDYPYLTIIGLGTGAFGPPLEGVTTSYIYFPSVLFVGGAEFHNSFIDYFVSFGVLGMVLIYFYYKRLVGLILLSPQVISLLGFSCFHLTYRHPIFWVTMYFLFSENVRSQNISMNAKGAYYLHSNDGNC